MSTTDEIFGHKIVTAGQINFETVVSVRIADEVRKIILESNLPSLQGLLGPNSEKVLRKLAAQYWGIE